MTRLVLVHGRSQQNKNPDDLKHEWVTALRQGLAATGRALPIDEDDVAFPFYGDTLRDLTEKRTTIADVIQRGQGISEAESIFLATVVDEARTQAGITDGQIASAQAELTATDPHVRERGPQNWPWVLATLRCLDTHLPASSAPSIAAFTRDVYLYLRTIGIRDRIDTGVLPTLTPNGPMVVVGHSLGSVVTYSLLSREGAPQRWQVPLYVTVGSPLGISAIRRMLQPAWPACVTTWLNARDSRDVVALFPLDADHFPTSRNIDNYQKVHNPTPNRHGISGYLADPNVAAAIYEGLVAG